MEEDGHPLAQGTTSHSTQQDGTTRLFLEVGSIGEFRTVFKDIDGNGTKDATEAIGCRT